MNKQNYIPFSDNYSLSQNHNSLSKTQNSQDKNFCSHDDREIVMANDEAFGALDFQHDDINFDADNELSQLLLPTFSDKTRTKLSLDAHNPDIVPHGNDSNDDINPNNILPTARSLNEAPTPLSNDKLDSNVEDRPHTETEPQLLQQ